MKLNPISINQTLPQDKANSIPNWQLGTTVVAAVVNQKTNGEIELRIGNTQFATYSNQPLKPGSEISLKLTDLGSPAVVKALNMPREMLQTAQQPLVVLPNHVNSKWKSGQQFQAQIVQQNRNGLTTMRADNNLLIKGYTTRAVQINESVALRVVGDNQLNILHFQDSDSNPSKISNIRQPHISLNIPLPLQQTMRLGQQLNAKVVNASNSGLSTLEISGKQFTSTMPLPLSAGQKLGFELVEFSKPIKFSVEKTSTAINPKHELLRTLLPQQASLATLLTNLQLISQTSIIENNIVSKLSALNPTLSQQLFNLARKIFQQSKSSTALTDKNQLKTAILQSGIGLEKLLANLSFNTSTESLLAGDLKANLLRLVAILQSALPDNSRSNRRVINKDLLPPLPNGMPQAQPVGNPLSLTQIQSVDELLNLLLNQARGALARIQLHQLASEISDNESTRCCFTEIPITHNNRTDTLHIKFERHLDKKKSKQDSWVVMLAIDLETIGPMHVKLTLNNNQIGTTIWTERQDTKELVEQFLPTLKQNFQNKGISFRYIGCRLGAPTVHTSRNLQEHILDIKV